jgi:predicted ArsR family transcriptional regulator
MSEVPDWTGQVVDEESIKRLFRELSRPVITAKDVASTFEISPQAANYHLKRFANEGVVTREKVGAAAVVYWLPESSTNSNETEAAI